MTICYSGKSAPSAQSVASAMYELTGEEQTIVRRNSSGDINWGRYKANTKLNPDIRNSTNKRVMRELFKEHDVPMPKLLNLEEVRLAVEQGQTVVGRPDRHTKGRGFWLIRNEADLEKALRGTRKKLAATHFMEFVEADHEVRVHIFKGKSIRISEKSFFFEEYNGKKYRDYTTIKPTIKRKRVRRAAKKAVQALGLDFGAVDILATDDACYVLEVNAAPGLGGSMPRLYAETFIKWFEEGNHA